MDEPQEFRDVLRGRGDLPRERPQRRVVTVTGIDPELLPWARTAVQDLARRLDLPTDQIQVVAVGAVTWSDRSCGCRKPGMRYPQVPVDGAYARLEAAGRSWHYHGAAGREPFLCDG